MSFLKKNWGSAKTFGSPKVLKGNIVVSEGIANVKRLIGKYL